MVLVPFIFKFKVLKPEENCLNLERDPTASFLLPPDPTVTGHGLCNGRRGSHQGQGNQCDSFLLSGTQCLAKETISGDQTR